MRKRDYLRILGSLLLLEFGAITANAQTMSKGNMLTTAKTDSAKQTGLKDSTASKVLSYRKVIPAKAISQKGLLTVDMVDKKWYLEIPDSILGKDILIVNRISKAAVNNKPEYRKSNQSMSGYAGDEVNETIIRFERNGDDIRVRETSFAVYGLKPGDPMFANVKRSDILPIVLTLPVKAIAPDSSRVVEITPVLQQDNPLFAFGPATKSAMQLVAFDASNSYIQSICAYPQNMSFKTVKTYKQGSGSTALPSIPGLNTGTAPIGANATYELNSSWILLPEKPMRTREYDHRIGYFSTGFTDFGKSDQSAQVTALINRWRLEPRSEDRQKYLAGELVEPAKPILIYIDPTTPEKWVPYLIKGINDWQKAFEKAGFKNAISARRAPTAEQDPTWSIDDVRYSTLVYMPSTYSNAMGPHVSDPRTGEILETHINWYHNVMSLLHTWYMMQCAAVDPRARKAEFDEELMGELIRFVSSHEVGHALGLRHNFQASNATPVEKLREKAWVEQHGHTSSIMDYARFNYVAQPQDHISPAGLYPRIGDYDMWAIEWGYKWFGDITSMEETGKLNAMVLSNNNNPRLQFGPGREEGLSDPRAQAEDLSDNDMKANTYGMKNLQYVAKNMTKWLVKKDGSNYQDLSKGYNGLLNQYTQFLTNVMTYIGGIYVDNKYADQTNNVFSPAPVEKQKEALSFIDKFFFHNPSWLVSDDLSGRLINPQIDLMPKLTNLVIDQLYDVNRLSRLISCSARYGSKAYQPLDYLKSLQERIWSELPNGHQVSVFRMQLQNAEIAKLGEIVNPNNKEFSLNSILASITKGNNLSQTEIVPIARMLLTDLNGAISRSLKSGKVKDAMTRAHLKGAQAAIKKILDDRA